MSAATDYRRFEYTTIIDSSRNVLLNSFLPSLQYLVQPTCNNYQGSTVPGNVQRRGVFDVLSIYPVISRTVGV